MRLFLRVQKAAIICSFAFLLMLLALPSMVFGSVQQQRVNFVSPILIANTSFLNVRTGPQVRFDVLVTVTGGTEMPVLARASDGVWYQVSTAAGVGWVNSQFTIARGNFENVPTIALSEFELPDARVVQSSVVLLSRTYGLQATVNVTSVDLRSGPSSSSTPIGILFSDSQETYAVVGRTTDVFGTEWIAIVVPAIGTGWIEAPKATISGVPGVPIIGTAVARVVINTSFLNVRSGPGPDYTLITSVRGGTEFPVTGQSSANGGWFQIAGSFGSGWVNNDFVLFRGSIENVPTIENATGVIAQPIAIVSVEIPLYYRPSVAFGTIGTVVPGEYVIIGRNEDFSYIEIRSVTGTLGWLITDQVIVRGNSALIPVIR